MIKTIILLTAFLLSACGDSIPLYMASRSIDDQVGLIWITHDSKLLQITALALAEQVRMGTINPDKITGIFKTQMDAQNSLRKDERSQ